MPPHPPDPGLDPAITRALASGKVKAMGDLLFVPPASETMMWDEADKKCRFKRVAGVGKFRLPTKGQVSRLRAGGRVQKGTFWTRQSVGGDEAYAFDAGSGKSHIWLKMEPTGQALCVRSKK